MSGLAARLVDLHVRHLHFNKTPRIPVLHCCLCAALRCGRYQKLYSDFKSEKYGWRMILLFRKLLLVSTTVMFNQLPLFQASSRARWSCWYPAARIVAESFVMGYWLRMY
jgi:hypothetical protein